MHHLRLGRVVLLFLLTFRLTMAAQNAVPRASAGVQLHFESPIRNGHIPQLDYLFLKPDSLSNHSYRDKLTRTAHDTAFDFIFVSGRGGVNPALQPSARDAIADAVSLGHRLDLRIGLTLYAGGLRSPAPDDANDQTVIADTECILDPSGACSTTSTVELRNPPRSTGLLQAWVFRKTGRIPGNPDTYDPATLTDVTAQLQATSPAPGTLTVTAALGSQYAGYTLLVLAETHSGTLDLFSRRLSDEISTALSFYRNVPLDGTAMDEFGYMRMPLHPKDPWRAHLAGRAFAAAFEAETSQPLTVTILHTRYAPVGHPEVRIRAINQYWDFYRQGPLRAEREFVRLSQKLFGESTFAGIHNTVHNHLTNDEPWASGLNWWTLPRYFGQSDEDLPLPLRMGLLVSHPAALMYDQYYGDDIEFFATKALRDARFNARIHYCTCDDTAARHVDVLSDEFLRTITPIERKLRLLNRFDPVAPDLPLLVVFGMPRLLDWYPNTQDRNNFDLNGSLQVEEKAQALWDAGYRAAVVPSDLIDSGALTLDAQNRPTLNGHTFRALIFLGPEFSKPTTLDFLARYIQHGGPLMLEGTVTRDFLGNPISARFARTLAQVRISGFSLSRIAELGIQPSPLQNTGGELADGSVILTDRESIRSGRHTTFTLTLHQHVFSGAYTGVLALKAAPDGSLDKLACGACQAILRDGKPLLEVDHPADLVIIRSGSRYDVTVEGAEGSNSIHLH